MVNLKVNFAGRGFSMVMGVAEQEVARAAARRLMFVSFILSCGN